MRVGQRPSTGEINLEHCAKLRGLIDTETTRRRNSNSSPTQLTFFSEISDSAAPGTPRRRIVSLPPHLERQHSPESVSGQIGSTKFMLQPARFTPRQRASTTTSPSSTSSLTITRPTPTPFNSTAQSPTTKRPTSTRFNMPSENPRPVPLFRGDYGDKEEPTEWFAQFELSLLESWDDDKKVDRFEMQLAPGNLAEEWFQDNVPTKSITFASLKLAFRGRWPPPRRPRYTRAQQKERIMAEILEENEIGSWTAGNYGHAAWATKVSRLALGMGDVEGHLIEYVLEGIPNLLKDHLKCDYKNWDEFIEDVQTVPSVKIKRGREDLDKERARDADIARLKAQSTPSMTTLQQQFAQLATSTYRPSTYRAAVRAPTPSNPPPLLVSNPTNIYPFSTAPALSVRGGFNMRGTPFTRTQLTRTQILEKLSAVPQRSNTETGVRQYEADVELWHRTHGTEGFPTIERPYPLRPGTAILGSGECYNCGMVTEPPHVGAQCIVQEPLKPQEARWRQQVAGLLRRTASPMNRPGYAVTPVQYVTSDTHPNYGTYRATTTTPVYTIAQHEEQGGWDGQDTWGMQEAGYDWIPENGLGPLPTADQQ
ncbi:hypothetical protein DEU56DRAFT_911467 [Suillus clintonianus]|uniref:uncharacterized protein n=1 Tax=Suillus clintonianus TaxID=1904413 RepID=UPI001B880B64|nr:uncharacterized protein DEU56DRAFT_911467 [Suillus clintonianus]KAG2141360.1 hypothetical protein DEU56DRAFT_911467 [Suillus clintonianus]